MGYRSYGYGGRFGGGPAVETSWEKQVLALSRACSEFGLTVEEVEAIPPARYNTCHGNSYAVWNKQQLSDARAAKAAAGREVGVGAHRGAELAPPAQTHRAAAHIQEWDRSGTGVE